MLRLHMVPCTIAVLVGELATDSTVKLLIKLIFLHKLKQLTWILESVSYQQEIYSNKNTKHHSHYTIEH